MAFDDVWLSAVDNTSCPNPNTLTTKNPYDATYDKRHPYKGVSADWAAQVPKALFAQHAKVILPTPKKIWCHFALSDPAAICTVSLWIHSNGDVWAKPNEGANLIASIDIPAGGTIDYIEDPGDDPLYLSVDSITATETLTVRYDAQQSERIAL